MKRRATREVLYERIQCLRDKVPDLVLSADIMVGFPTESEAHFQETCLAVEELVIPFPHVFSYSSRPGTPASRIPKQVPKEVRKRRANEIRAIGRRAWLTTATALVGQTLKVLVESRADTEDEWSRARAANYFSVKLKISDDLLKTSQMGWQEVEITGFEGNSLIARSFG